jgi:hypothetical protein
MKLVCEDCRGESFEEEVDSIEEGKELAYPSDNFYIEDENGDVVYQS